MILYVTYSTVKKTKIIKDSNKFEGIDKVNEVRRDTSGNTFRLFYRIQLLPVRVTIIFIIFLNHFII